MCWGGEGGEGGEGKQGLCLCFSLCLTISFRSVSVVMQAMIEEVNYEDEREARIARNNLLLVSLGFTPMIIGPPNSPYERKRSRGLPPNSPYVSFPPSFNPYVSFLPPIAEKPHRRSRRSRLQLRRRRAEEDQSPRKVRILTLTLTVTLTQTLSLTLTLT